MSIASQQRKSLVVKAFDAARDAALIEPFDHVRVLTAIEAATPPPLDAAVYRGLKRAGGSTSARPTFAKWISSGIRTAAETVAVIDEAIANYESVTDQIVRRSGGTCEARVPGLCNANPAVAFHHVMFQSQGGWRTVTNLLHVCRYCHTWIHAHIAEAIVLGLAHPDTPLELNAAPQPHNWYLVVDRHGNERVMSRNKARKFRRRKHGATVTRLPVDDPRIPLDDPDEDAA